MQVIQYMSTPTDSRLELGDTFVGPVNALYDTEDEVREGVVKMALRYDALYGPQAPPSAIWKVTIEPPTAHGRTEVVECCVVERLADEGPPWVYP